MLNNVSDAFLTLYSALAMLYGTVSGKEIVDTTEFIEVPTKVEEVKAPEYQPISELVDEQEVVEPEVEEHLIEEELPEVVAPEDELTGDK